MFEHDGESRGLLMRLLPGIPLLFSLRFSDFKKTNNKDLYTGFHNLENYSLYWQKAFNSLMEYMYLLSFY